MSSGTKGGHSPSGSTKGGTHNGGSPNTAGSGKGK